MPRYKTKASWPINRPNPLTFFNKRSATVSLGSTIYCICISIAQSSFVIFKPLNMLSERESIAIAELAVYIPSILLALAVIFKHGFSKGRPWVYLVAFCGLRIASAVLEVLSSDHPTSRSDATWTAILGSIGLSPLFLAASGLLRRVYIYPR